MTFSKWLCRASGTRPSDDLHHDGEAAEADRFAIPQFHSRVGFEFVVSAEGPVGTAQVLQAHTARTRRRMNDGMSRRRGRMVELDVEALGCFEAADAVGTLEDVPGLPEFGLVAHQKPRQDARGLWRLVGLGVR